MAKIKDLSIFLTGSGGFVGRHILEKLGKKYNIKAPKKDELNLLDTDAVKNYFAENDFDIVIHCAVVGGSRTEEEKDNSLFENLKIFFNLVHNLDKKIRMIMVGSGAEYNKKFPIVNIMEDEFGKSIPDDNYGLYKFICAKYIEGASNIVNLRVFGLYGKGEDSRYRFISNSIGRLNQGKPIIIRQNVFFEYVYIDDFVRIIEYFVLNKPKHKFYNIGRNNKIDILTIAKKLVRLGKFKSKIVLEQNGLNDEYTCNSDLLLKELEKFKFTDFDESLIELLKWYKDNEKIEKC